MEFVKKRKKTEHTNIVRSSQLAVRQNIHVMLSYANKLNNKKKTKNQNVTIKFAAFKFCFVNHDMHLRI